MTEVNSLKRKYADIPTVTIVVGNEEKNFAIHDEKLFAASPVLKDLFDQIDKKGSARLLNLVDHDADLFEIFVDWLYSGVLNLPKFGPNQREKGTVMYAVRLYGMAEKFQALRLKNDVCKYLFVLVTKANFEAPPRCAIVQAYHHTPNKSMIRRLLVDWFVYNTKSDWFQATSNQSWLVSLPRFAMDLAVGFSQGGSCEPQDGPFAKGNTNHYAEVAVRMNQQTTTEAKPNGNMNKAPGPVIYEID